MNKLILLLIGLVSFSILFGCVSEEDSPTAQLDLQLIQSGFNSPVYLASPNDSSELFVVDRIGIIKVIGEEEEFLDIRNKMVSLSSNFDERGLLGLAFHPDFENNGKFFVYYSAPLREEGPQGWNHTSTISEFTFSKDTNRVNIESEKIILQIDEPQFNHNGGQLLFGMDGYLYIAVGDGGEANDVGVGHSSMGNAQDTNTLLGKILRININSVEPYSIPADNPFVGTDGLDEIYAYGFRNPFRMAFDKTTGNLFVADVGQNAWEEVSIVEKGKNYGWNIKEGTHCFDSNFPNDSPVQCANKGYKNEELIDPIIEYQNANRENGIGLSVIGGFVYRGNQIQGLNGKYIFGDWSNSFVTGKGTIFTAEEKDGNWQLINSQIINSFILGFGEDSNNELYVLTSDTVGPTGNSGKVYKIIKSE